jgi:hypothetical protein
LTLPGLEPQPLSRPARSQSLYRLRYPGSQSRCKTIILSLLLSEQWEPNYPEWPVLPHIRLIFRFRRCQPLHSVQFLIFRNPTEYPAILFTISIPMAFTKIIPDVPLLVRYSCFFKDWKPCSLDASRFRPTFLPESPSFKESSCLILRDDTYLAPCHSYTAGRTSAGGDKFLP